MVNTVTFKYDRTPRQILIPIILEYVNDSGFIERKKVNACVDTGATNSGIDSGLADKLDFTTIGTTKQKTAGGIVEAGIHTVNVGITENIRFDDVEITEINAGVEFIIGMDILGKGDFLLSHKGKNTFISFRFPTADKGEHFINDRTRLVVGERIY